jgi:hypothetical protein
VGRFGAGRSRGTGPTQSREELRGVTTTLAITLLIVLLVVIDRCTFSVDD